MDILLWQTPPNFKATDTRKEDLAERRKWEAGGAMVLEYKGDEGWEGGELREARPGRLRASPGNS